MSSAQSLHQQFGSISPATQRKHSKQKFVADLSQCLFDFVIQLLPTAEEMAVKEDVRKLLERLIRTIEPDSRLLSFGSTANGFSLRNSGEQSLPATLWISAQSSVRHGSLLSNRLRRTSCCNRSCDDVRRFAGARRVPFHSSQCFISNGAFRNQIPRQTPPTCADTNCEVVA